MTNTRTDDRNSDAAELERLRAEVARLQAGQPHKGRSFWVGLAAVAGLVVLLAASIAVFVDRTLLDTNDYVAAVAPLPSDPAVAGAVASAVVDGAFSSFDAEQLISQDLPSDLQPLAGPIAAGAETAAQAALAELIETRQFAEIWAVANRFAHSEALAVLRGQSIDGLSVQDGEVTLDLSAILGPVVDELGAGSVLSEAGPDAAKFVLFRDGQLGAAQRAVSWADGLAWALPILALALLAAAIWLSDDRRRTLRTIGYGTATVAVLSVVALDIGRGEVVNRVSDPAVSDAVASGWDAVTRGFIWQSVALGVVGAILVGAVWGSGSSSAADQLRARLAGRGAEPISPWLAEHRLAAMAAVGILGVIGALTRPQLTWPSFLVIAVLVGAGLAVIHGLSWTEQKSGPVAADRNARPKDGDPIDLRADALPGGPPAGEELTVSGRSER